MRDFVVRTMDPERLDRSMRFHKAILLRGIEGFVQEQPNTYRVRCFDDDPPKEFFLSLMRFGDYAETPAPKCGPGRWQEWWYDPDTLVTPVKIAPSRVPCGVEDD